MRCKYKGFPAVNKPIGREYSLYTSFFVVLGEKYYKHGIIEVKIWTQNRKNMPGFFGLKTAFICTSLPHCKYL